MKITTIGRRLTASLSGPLIAAGIVLGSMVIGETASATAEPSTDSRCTSMPMTDGQNGTAPNALTRAGQVGAAAGPSASDGSMPASCTPASHG